MSKVYLERQNNSEYLRQRAPDNRISDRRDPLAVVRSLDTSINVFIEPAELISGKIDLQTHKGT